MQNSDNKIDKVFKNRLGDYEVAPPSVVWDRISDSMGYQRRKRRMLLIWTMAGAASLAFAFLMGWLLSDKSLNNDSFYVELNNRNAVISNQVILTSPIEQIINIHFDKPQFKKLFPSANRDRYEQILKSDDEKAKQFIGIHLMSPIDPSLLFYDGLNIGLAELKEDGLNEKDRNIIETNLLAMNTENSTENKNNCWSIGMQASPVSSFDKIVLKSDSKDMAFVDNALAYNTVQRNIDADYATTLSGGISVSYNAGKRLTFTSGVGYNEVSQNAGDVAISFAGQDWFNEGSDGVIATNNGSSSSDIISNNVILNTNLGLSNVVLPDGVALASVKTYSVAVESSQNYNFKQSAGYIEVPLLMHYQLIDKKVGLHLVGGVNTNFLVLNSVSFVNQNQVMATSITEDLRPVIFTSSVGVGLDYSISKRFSLNVEPTLKINLNTMNAQSGFDAKPYTFGIYSGISYQF